MGEVHNALLSGNIRTIKTLVKKNPGLDEKVLVSFVNKIKNLKQSPKPSTKLTLLYFAIMEDELEICEYLIKDGAILKVPQADFLQPVEFAFENKKFRIAHLLESHGGDLHSKDVQEKDPHLFKILKDNGVNVKSVNVSPLLTAIELGNLNFLNMLINAGANVHQGNYKQVKVVPLIFAVQNLKPEIVNLLLEKGAKVDAVSRATGNTALLEVANNHILLPEEREKGVKANQIVNTLLNYNANISVIGNIGVTALEVAIMVDNYDIVTLLLKSGARTKNLKGVLLPAVKNGDKNAINVCFEFGEDFNCTDMGGKFPYHYALRNQSPEALNVFWKYGCPFDQPLNYHYPGTFDIFTMVKMSNRNKAHLKNQQCFIEGISKNDVNQVLEALQRGAEVRGCSVAFKSPLHLVCQKGYYEMAKVLLEKGIQVNTIYEGKMPIHIAAKCGYEKICKILLQHGACFDYKTNDGTPLQVSKQHKNVQKLLKDVRSTFKVTKLGNAHILGTLQQTLENDHNLFLVLVNSVDSRGLNLMGTALSRGFTDIIEGIMKLWLQSRVKQEE